MQLCGDPTCESRSCSSEALDEHFARQEADAREVVRAALGLHPLPDAPEPLVENAWARESFPFV